LSRESPFRNFKPGKGVSRFGDSKGCPALSKNHSYSLREEFFNSLTHGVGAAFSVAALTLMVVFAVFGADPWRIVSVSIFGATLIILYLASTLYHAFQHPVIKRYLRVFDHCSIYLLIAGTYTPFLLVSLRGPWGWSMFALLWSCAVAGCVFKMFCIGRWDKLATLMYVAMGWLVLIALKPVIDAVPVGALLLMLVGGLAYTGGVVFYLWDRIPYNHAIWHLFVLGGSLAHFFAIFFYIALPSA
jgi:hemolysin III